MKQIYEADLLRKKIIPLSFVLYTHEFVKLIPGSNFYSFLVTVHKDKKRLKTFLLQSSYMGLSSIFICMWMN